VTLLVIAGSFTQRSLADEKSAALAVGVAQHGFDHLGAIGDQAEAAAAAGMTVIYTSAIGSASYEGYPPADQLAKLLSDYKAYNAKARTAGIKLVIGYICATSIVNLETFDKNWSPEFRARFKTPPAQWLQQGIDGQSLPSWYGGAYRPACMNNPDWIEYEKYAVTKDLEAGDDGIFFDNPTVHPQGCYCSHCMNRFSAMLVSEKLISADIPTADARELTKKYPDRFRQFRACTARDFLKTIRDHARTLKPDTLVTCNNSLNTPSVLFSQAQMYGYNIYEMTKSEDLLVVEDMTTQPRMLPGGRTLEYGPTLAQLHAISRGRPIVANVCAEGDYHTAPNLVRLAMAEATAHDASYLAWPTWPENQRRRMIQAIRPQVDFLRTNAALFSQTQPRRDITLFLPFRQWLKSPKCEASTLAARLTAANIQYAVVSEDDFVQSVTPKPDTTTARGTAAGLPVRQICLIESRSVLQPAEKTALEQFEAAGGLALYADESDWMKDIETRLSQSLQVIASPTIRAVARDQKDRTIVHLYNLGIERLSSFEDKVTPAADIALRVRVPFSSVKSVKALSVDAEATKGDLKFTTDPTSSDVVIETKILRLQISTILVIEP
jgi:hypothetical protein